MGYLQQLHEMQQLHNLTQQDLSNRLGITTAALNRWLTGKAQPRRSSVQEIARLYHTLAAPPRSLDPIALQIFSELQLENTDTLQSGYRSEAILRDTAILINESSATAEYIYALLLEVPTADRDFDWNIASILQHCDPTVVFDMFRRIQDTSIYYGSMGLAWLFGELGLREPKIVTFLTSIVNYSQNSDAWWRAAFSLQQLGAGNAVNLLKTSLRVHTLQTIDYYLQHIDDKKSVICILILSTVDNLEHTVYPKVRELFLTSSDTSTLINCAWLIGRLNLMDAAITTKLILLMEHQDYELKYYTLFALQNNTNEALRPTLETALNDPDPLIRKMACRGLRNLGNEASIPVIEASLYNETSNSVITELTQAIYSLRDPSSRSLFELERKSSRNENGMIIDESDKWYSDASIYNIFSEAEDPYNICFSLIRQAIDPIAIHNPIDLATGTGRALKQISRNVPYSGTLYGVDLSKQMCDYVTKSIKRERSYTNKIEIINTSIENFAKKQIRSNFIISSFGFPSKVSDTDQTLRELRAVHSLLEDGGVFVTLGWDEEFNDELSETWYKYIPDSIQAQSFEEWRRKRASSIKSARNCGLTWFKKGLRVPLQFSSLQDSASVIGYLFGRDAAHEVIRNRQLSWGMSLGITIDTKESIRTILESYETRN